MLTKQQRARNAVRFMSDPRKARCGRLESRVALIGREAVEPLLEAIDSPSSEMRMRCAWSLGLIGDPRGFEAILKQVLDDPVEFVRYEAALSLGNLGDERAIPYLAEIIKKCNPCEESVSGAATQAIEKFGEKAVPCLLKLLDVDNINARALTLAALGKIADPSALDALAHSLGHSNEDVRAAAVNALADFAFARYQTHGQQCLDLIRNHLNDSSESVRSEANYWIKDVYERLEERIPKPQSVIAWKIRLINKTEADEMNEDFKRMLFYRRKRQKMGIKRNRR